MSDPRSYFQIIERLEKLRDEPARENRVPLFREALKRLSRERGIAIRGEAVVLVAGTNGKGSVSKTLETLLARPGRSIGLFTSPHMMDTTERIRSDGRDLTRDEFVQCFTTVEPFTNGLSHFEILTLMMAEAFFGGRIRRAVDLAIVEVGVGGRLDPTRVFPHDVSVVTRIGLDHEEILGGSLEAIAREKFAIVDPGNVVVSAPLSPGGRRVFEERKNETPGTYVEVPDAEFVVATAGPAPTWTLRSRWGDAPLSLKGRRAAENANVALHVLSMLGEDVEAALPLLTRVEWPCRMEGFVIDGREVYLSGDHNAQGAASLVEILGEFRRPSVRLVVGLGKNKSVDDFLEPLAALPGAKLHLTKTTFRSGDLTRYGDWLSRAASTHEDPSAALAHALALAKPGELVVVTGSLYLTGDLRRAILQGAFGETKPIK